jgi:hypothetical protein
MEIDRYAGCGWQLQIAKLLAPLCPLTSFSRSFEIEYEKIINPRKWAFFFNYAVHFCFPNYL